MALDIHTLFSYHRPTPDQIPRFERITAAALEFAKVLQQCCPDGGELTLALRHIQDARFRANAAIAIGEAGTEPTKTPAPKVALITENIQSSNVEAVAWEGDDGEEAIGLLTVRYRSSAVHAPKVYVYEGVARAVYHAIVGAESVGKAVDKLVKKAPYTFRVLPDVDLAPESR